MARSYSAGEGRLPRNASERAAFEGAGTEYKASDSAGAGKNSLTKSEASNLSVKGLEEFAIQMERLPDTYDGIKGHSKAELKEISAYATKRFNELINDKEKMKALGDSEGPWWKVLAINPNDEDERSNAMYALADDYGRQMKERNAPVVVERISKAIKEQFSEKEIKKMGGDKGVKKLVKEVVDSAYTGATEISRDEILTISLETALADALKSKAVPYVDLPPKVWEVKKDK